MSHDRSWEDNLLWLSGFMGAGKSTLGPLLAEEFGWSFLDSDRVIEDRERRSVSEIFAKDGEVAFRDLEARVIAELSALKWHVIAVGGGALLREENRKAVARSGKLIYLKASPEALYERLKRETEKRPLLKSQAGETREEVEIRLRAQIDDLLKKRGAFYEAADIIVETDHKSGKEIAAEVYTRFKASGEASASLETPG